MSGLKAYCDICNLWLNSNDQLAAHQTGKSHKRRETCGGENLCCSSQISGPISEQKLSIAHLVANQENSSKLTSQNNDQNVNESCKILREDVTGQNEAGRTKSVMGYEYFCNICVVKLTSKTQADMHFEGSKHKRTLAVMAGKLEEIKYEGAKIKTEDVCEICNVPLPSKAVADAHYAGSKHEKKLKLSQSIRGNLGPVSSGEKIQSIAVITPLPVITRAPSQNAPGSSVLVVPIPLGAALKQRQGPVGGHLYCSFCNVGVNSQQQMYAHWQGTKHKNNVNGIIPQPRSTFTPRPAHNHGRYVNSGHVFSPGGYGSSNGQAAFRSGQHMPYASHQF